MGSIYFLVINGGIIDNKELSRMAYIVDGKHINFNDLDAIREYAKSCKGLQEEINPSVEMFLKNNEKVKAIIMYHNEHPEVGLVEAKNIIENMSERLN